MNIELLHENPGFSLEIAHILANASLLAYRNEESIKREAQSWGFTECTFFSEKDTQGFIASDDKVAILSFRGSQSAGDWLIDIDIRTTEREYEGETVIVHNGFARGYDAVASVIQNKLAEIKAEQLWITGHSLGGALANLAGAELLEFADQVLGIYTFGQPKVGRGEYDHLLKAQYKGKYFRFVNDTDLVPRLPRKYHHNGNLLQFDAEGILPTSDDGSVVINADSWKSLPKVDGVSTRGLGTEESFALLDEDEMSDEEYAALMAEIETAMAQAEPELESAEFEEDELATRSIRSKVLPFMRKALEKIPGIVEHDIVGYIRKIEGRIG